MTNSENRLLQELNETVAYCKQQVSKVLFEMHTKREVDVSRNDLAKISEKVGLSLDHVYRDVARNYNAIKEDVQRDKEELKRSFEAKLEEQERKK